MQHLFPTIKTIVFDPVQDLFNARKDPDLFLDSFPAPLVLDEIQFAPELLPSIKRRVDLSKKKGLYFLTGSQNLSMLRSVAESMAGRVAVIKLENFTLQELVGQGSITPWLNNYLEDPTSLLSTMQPSSYQGSLVEFLWRGVFPGAAELPNSQIPLFFQSYLQTYVERDVRLLEQIQQLAEFDRFLGLIASLTAQEVNTAHLGREIGITPQTARRWLDVLTHSYQWEEVAPYHGNTLKRITAKKKGMMKDSGLACYLQKIPSPQALAVSPNLGHIFETWVNNSIRQQGAALPVAPNIFHWRTGGGAEVDIVLEWNQNLYPIEVKCKSVLKKSDLSSLKAFRETYTDRTIMPGLIIYAGTQCYYADKHIIALPWNFLPN